MLAGTRGGRRRASAAAGSVVGKLGLPTQLARNRKSPPPRENSTISS